MLKNFLFYMTNFHRKDNRKYASIKKVAESTGIEDGRLSTIN